MNFAFAAFPHKKENNLISIQLFLIALLVYLHSVVFYFIILNLLRNFEELFQFIPRLLTQYLTLDFYNLLSLFNLIIQIFLNFNWKLLLNQLLLSCLNSLSNFLFLYFWNLTLLLLSFFCLTELSINYGLFFNVIKLFFFKFVITLTIVYLLSYDYTFLALFIFCL